MLIDVSEQWGGEVTFAGIWQHGEDHGTRLGLLGDLQCCCDGGTAGDPRENTFLRGQATGHRDCIVVGNTEDVVWNGTIQYLRYEIGCPSLNLVGLPFLP